MHAALFISISMCVVAVAVTTTLSRMLCKSMSGPYWSLAYVRSASNTAVFANLVLIMMTLFANSTYRDWTNMSLTTFDSLNALTLMTMVDYYLSHFCPTVILPAIFVALIGRAFARRKVRQSS